MRTSRASLAAAEVVLFKAVVVVLVAFLLATT
jgi:hypothetical protein